MQNFNLNKYKMICGAVALMMLIFFTGCVRQQAVSSEKFMGTITNEEMAHADSIYGVYFSYAGNVIWVKRFGVESAAAQEKEVMLKNGLEYHMDLNMAGNRALTDISYILKRNNFKSAEDLRSWVDGQPEIIDGKPHKLVTQDIGVRLFDLFQEYHQSRFQRIFKE